MLPTRTMENSLQIGSKTKRRGGPGALPKKIPWAGINPAPTREENPASLRICKIGGKG